MPLSSFPLGIGSIQDSGFTFVDDTDTGISRVQRVQETRPNTLNLSVDNVGAQIFLTGTLPTSNVNIAPSEAVSTTSNGRTMFIRGGRGGTVSGNGGLAVLSGGIPTEGDGGSVTVGATHGIGTNRNGGTANFAGGNSTGTGTGGSANVTGGNSTGTGTGGIVYVRAGNSPSGTAGGLELWTGTGSPVGLNLRNRSSGGGIAFWASDTSYLVLETTTLRPETDNTLSLGQGSRRFSEVFAATGVINTSDKRFKTDIKDLDYGLDMVKAISPKSFKLSESKKFLTSLPVTTEDGETIQPATFSSAPGRRTHFGFLAQDIKDYLNSTDYALWTLDNPEDPDSRQGIRPDQLIAVLWRAVQELSNRLDTLEGNK